MAEGEQNLDSLFEQLGAKPKVSNPDELVNWMREFVAHKEEYGELSMTPNQPTSFGSQCSPKQVLTHQVRLPNFSGDGKNDVPFDLWKYEVKCLYDEQHSKDVLRHAIRRSLRGEAARIVMRLGSKVTIDGIIEKLECVYGEVEAEDVLLTEFYSARQKDSEDVSAWSCRLENLLDKAMSDETSSKDKNKLLRIMFWSGLREDMKDITGYLFESNKDYDQLRGAVRRIEQGHKRRQEEHTSTNKQPASCKAIASGSSQLSDLTAMIQQLSTEVQGIRQDQQRIREQMDHTEQTPKFQQLRYNKDKSQTYNKDKSHTYNKDKSHTYNKDKSQTYNSQRSYNNQGKQNWKKREGNRDTYTDRRRESDANARDDPREREYICWKCGQPGHIAIGCKVRTDHQRKPLN